MNIPVEVNYLLSKTKFKNVNADTHKIIALASRCFFEEAVKNNNIIAAKWFYFNSKFNVTDNLDDGMSKSIEYACKNGNREMLEFISTLVEQSDPHNVNDIVMSLFMRMSLKFAIKYESVIIINWLVDIINKNLQKYSTAANILCASNNFNKLDFEQLLNNLPNLITDIIPYLCIGGHIDALATVLNTHSINKQNFETNLNYAVTDSEKKIWNVDVIKYLLSLGIITPGYVLFNTDSYDASKYILDNYNCDTLVKINATNAECVEHILIDALVKNNVTSARAIMDKFKSELKTCVNLFALLVLNIETKTSVQSFKLLDECINVNWSDKNNQMHLKHLISLLVNGIKLEIVQWAFDKLTIKKLPEKLFYNICTTCPNVAAFKWISSVDRKSVEKFIVTVGDKIGIVGSDMHVSNHNFSYDVSGNIVSAMMWLSKRGFKIYPVGKNGINNECVFASPTYDDLQSFYEIMKPGFSSVKSYKSHTITCALGKFQCAYGVERLIAFDWLYKMHCGDNVPAVDFVCFLCALYAS